MRLTRQALLRSHRDLLLDIPAHRLLVACRLVDHTLHDASRAARELKDRAFPADAKDVRAWHRSE